MRRGRRKRWGWRDDARVRWYGAWRYTRIYSRGDSGIRASDLERLDEVALRLLHLRHGVEPPEHLWRWPA